MKHIMHYSLKIFALLIGLAAFSYGTKVFELEDFQAVEKAHSEVDKVKERFNKQLKKALQKGDTQKALPFCKIEESSDYKIGRTSKRLRNPKNVPPEWTKPYLEKFSSSKPSEIPKQIFVKIEEGRYGYLEPIYVEPICLNCHGNLIPNVKKIIREEYPLDFAYDYKDGDFRGLIWLEMKVSPRK